MLLSAKNIDGKDRSVAQSFVVQNCHQDQEAHQEQPDLPAQQHFADNRKGSPEKSDIPETKVGFA